MPRFEEDASNSPSRAELLAEQPGSLRWARLCGWVPASRD
jgi:hypothetical protein